MKQKRLLRQLLLILVVMALALIVAISLLSFSRYSSEIKDEYTDLAFSYAKTAADYIDGGRIAGYLETGETDTYYNEVMDFLNTHLENSELEYYYVIVPNKEDFVYVWDSDVADDWRPLGYREGYSKGEEEIVESAFSRDPEEKPLYSSSEEYGSTVTLYYPVFDSSGDPAALVGVDLSMPEMNQKILQMTGQVLLWIIPIVVVVFLIFFWFLRKKLVKPVRILNSAVEDMAEHLEDEEVGTIPIRTGDEIEELAHSFEQMDGELKNYTRQLYEATLEEERVEAELSVAARIQENMLPRQTSELQDRSEFDLFASMTPAREVGGDFYDYFLLDRDHLAVLVADVSSKGVPSAMFMMTAKTLIRSYVETGMALDDVFTLANEKLCENNDVNMFLTAWLGVLDLRNGQMEYVNAGHNPPLLRLGDGEFKYLKSRAGFVLAGMEGVRYRKDELQMNPGDILFLYTDGVPESTYAQDQLYGTDRLLNLVNQMEPEAGAREICVAVHEDVGRFVGDAPQFDDITVLALKYLGEKAAHPAT